jgi:hypothetical protein
MINMHQSDEAVPFTAKSLEDAFKTNEQVKNFIANIKDDEKTGSKYVYLKRIDDGPTGPGEEGLGGPSASEPEKIVSKMADKAVSNRS